MRRLITDGVWARGEKLPGSRLIARDAKVSRTTVLSALDMLVSEGLLETRGRSGTYVAWTRSVAKAVAPGTTPDMPALAPKEAPPFTVGAPGLDLFPLKAWRRFQARRWARMPLTALEDGDDAGWLELRTAIAAHVDASRAIKCRAEQVIIMTSAQSAIHLAARVLTERGQQAWMEEPGYHGTRSALLAVGASPVPVPVDHDGLRVDEALRVAPSALFAVVTPSCQFPTGVVMSPSRRRQLLAWAMSVNGWIVEDDYDSEFPFAKNSQQPLAAMADGSRVIYVNTFSKTLFPSLRLAYLIAPDALVDRFLAARRGIDRNTTVPNQMVVADFLNTGQFAKHLRRTREAYRERHTALVEGLRQELGEALSIDRQSPGLHVCATFTADIGDAEVAALALRQGVVVEPLSQFFAGTPFRQGILLGYPAFSPDAIRRNVRTLARVIKPLLTLRQSLPLSRDCL